MISRRISSRLFTKQIINIHIPKEALDPPDNILTQSSNVILLRHARTDLNTKLINLYFSGKATDQDYFKLFTSQDTRDTILDRTGLQQCKDIAVPIIQKTHFDVEYLSPLRRTI